MMAEVSAAAAAVGALCQAKTAFWAPIMDTIASSNDMEELYTALNEAIVMLGAKRDDHQNAIPRHKKKMLSRTYVEWIRRVIEAEEEVNKLLARYDRQSESSQILCFLPRLNFSNEMKKKGEKVIKLLEESNQLGRILVDQPAELVIQMIPPNIKKFSTLQKPLERTLDLLKNDKVKGIVITGMMGTGKTAIMKNLNNHEEVAKTFDMVMWIKVSTEDTEENLSMRHLQKVIAERLKVDMAGANHFDDIAQRISNELKGKRYLLLLDDVKADLDIHQIGIPPSDNGSKIVLTTRLSHICFPRVDQVVKVTYLSPRESWTMFQDVVNRPDLKDDRRAEALARQIVNECGGHPLLIKIIASVFKMKDDVKLWSEGFNSLKRFSTKEHHGLMELNNVIKFCYYDLEDTQRKCFLYGALYPEESDIYKDYLLECWEAEDLLGNGDARKATIDGLHVLDHLKTKSLLEEGKSRKYVTMHKCIRQVALYISSDDPKCKLLVKTNILQMPLDAECWSEKNWISLVENKVNKLPDYPNCGLLSTLFLQKNLALKSIPVSFFEHMISLKVLDLCHTGITLLPSSLSKVIGLEVLYLCYCEYLVELPSSLEKLEHLEVLDIRGSGFNNIPCYIGNLKGLRRFRVSITKCGSENDTEEVGFNYHVISKLSKLEELVIDVKSPRHQSNKVVGNVIKSVTTLEKLLSLQFWFSDEVVDVIEVVLTSLRIHVPEADILHTFIEKTHLWRNIQSFHFLIGCQDSDYPPFPSDHHYKRYVKYCNGEGSNHPIFEVLYNVDAFELVEHKDIKQLSDLGTTSMNEVQYCLIESCGELETAVDSTIFPNLEHLYMKNLRKLQSIWNDRVERSRLTKLKTLVLSICHLLRNVFPLVVIQQLLEIEYLKIEDCSEIVELVEKSQTTRNVDLLPKLKKLILLNMPKLESICADEVSKWPALEKLEIHNCPALRNLPFSKDTTKLKKLILLGMPNLDTICSNESLKWPALKKLKIHNCPALHKLPFNKDNAEKMELIQAEQQWWEALQWSNNEVKEQLQQFCDFSS